MPIYDRIISLGANCECAWHIRNYFGIETAYPFDRWITSHDSVVEILTSNFSKLPIPESLKVINNGETVRCEKYNILHHHDFERDENGVVLPDLCRQIPRLREKYAALIARFYRDCGEGRILFIRNRATADDRGLSPWKNIELRNLLAMIFPSADISLLVSNTDAGLNGDARVMWEKITVHNDLPEGDWRVSGKGWSEMFNRLDIHRSTNA
jgi:putative papain-like cysteine peptidase DUF1796